MLKDANFLCEIGTEEIPAGYIPPAMDSINKIVSDTLAEKRIDYEDISVYATPRRFAIIISKLSDKQNEEETELKGPSVKAAYDDDSKPTRALQGFMNGNGLTEKDVFTRETEKGGYIFARKKMEAKNTKEIIPDIISSIIENLPFPKKMKWSDKNLLFPRPISYFLILFNDTVIPFEMEGIQSSRKTRGHYIQHNEMIEVPSIADYEDTLKKNGVIINHNIRKETIKKELISAAKKTGGILHEDEELLDTVTFLAESPYITVCNFKKEFLSIPDIALIAEMREHQKYFSVMDKNGRLTNTFLVISNNPPTDYVVAGNERVITARFNDAQFFYNEDKKLKLSERVESLKNVLFHKELGSIHDKIERMKVIAENMIKALAIDSKTSENILKSIRLCKTDLVTAMVNEFPSLQGKMGQIYALEDGENKEVADAIEDHYKPRFHGDLLPESMVSIIVSLSEKLDNIFGSFSVGNIPKGSQDPYALRRQANAVLELILKNEINISMKNLLSGIAGIYKNGDTLVDQILDFITARAKTILSDRGLNYDEIDACLSTGNSDFLELMRRAMSINEFRKNEKFSDMLLSFKRMNNIVSAFKKKNKDHTLAFDQGLLQNEAEKSLHDFFQSRKKNISEFISASSYIELFNLLIDGKAIIDNFFDEVLVMDKDEKIRDNRLSLLEDILNNFTGLMDFSRIEDK